MSQPQGNRQHHHANHGRKRPRNNQRHDRPRNFRTYPNHTAGKNTIAVPLCSVCEQEPQPKYKCPKCRATYCSIACCRQHKEKGCLSEPVPPAATEASISKYVTNASKLASGVAVAIKGTSQGNQNTDDWEEGWKITPEMKTRLLENEWLHRELRDVGLRQLLLQIYEASNIVSRKKRYGDDSSSTEQEQMLEKIKEENPQLKLFLDKLLLISGVLEYSGKSDISELLSRDLDDIREHLTLAPSKRIVPASALVDSSESDGEEDVTSSDDDDSSSAASSSSDSDNS